MKPLRIRHVLQVARRIATVAEQMALATTRKEQDALRGQLLHDATMLQLLFRKGGEFSRKVLRDPL